MTEQYYEYDGPFLNLHEVIQAARLNLAQGPWEYITGGSETETTVRRNRLAFDKLAIRPRVLRDVSGVDCSTTAFGRKLRLPVITAPVGAQDLIVEGGGATCGIGAGRFGCGQMLSSVSEPGLERVAEAAPDTLRIYQLYVRHGAEWVDEQVKRAIDHGYCAFAITVDVQWFSRRERDIAKRWKRKSRLRSGDWEHQSSFCWDDVKRFKDTHDIPLILKGIQTAEDADLACQHGANWVYVSNHGGRQIDHGQGALEFLPECVAAVDGRAQILFDSGVMRGTDIVKAIGLGADLVGIGRLACLGLAAAGAEGLVRTLELLEDEVKRTLGLMGVRHWEEIEASQFCPGQPTAEPHVFSAFPLLKMPFDGDAP